MENKDNINPEILQSQELRSAYYGIVDHISKLARILADIHQNNPDDRFAEREFKLADQMEKLFFNMDLGRYI